jgi:chromosome segregation ATPase
MRFGKRLLWAVAASVVALTTSAVAQQSRDDGGAARLQAMVQQLTAERTQLQAQNAQLKTQLDAANAELKTLRDAQAGLEHRLGQSEIALGQTNASNTRNAELVTQLRTRTEEIVAQFRTTIDSLRATELERNELRTALAGRERAFDQCAANNQKLFDTGNEVLDRYEQKGCFSAFRENEPFTQNRRVQLQNLVDEYRWALEDQKLPAAEAQPAAAASGEGS